MNQFRESYKPLREAATSNMEAAKFAIGNLKFRHTKWQQYHEQQMAEMRQKETKNGGQITEETQAKLDQLRTQIRERREELESIFSLFETTRMLFEYLEVTGINDFSQGHQKGMELGFQLAKVQFKPETQTERFWKQRASDLRSFMPDTDLLTRLVSATPLKELA